MIIFVLFQNHTSDELKRRYEDSEGNAISRKKMKKQRRVERRPPKTEIQMQNKSGEICITCPNPRVTKSLNIIYYL